ncbi:hypothetical protein N7E02_04305 (plasmid) [Aliirhizobium terrae]|uniref:hypothetical protein n=1 Tax=Terrirhizobium terrae TaxID=2926709 RepID=UPI00257788DB|nr:hypothetical protein [Rhizobium sp. CC-CFT758]WJH38623.1 hypothetical protein N7E02_04305 [Rhizobium sp. CC-CFT758]
MPKFEAVKSVEAEKAAESRKSKEEKLDEGLKETFPASDPVSVSTPTKPAGSPDTDRGVN